ncbi:MAG TPA: hypothetical protein VD907_01260 [Verrucomicrobiae bacterium]|nr:hypothetical protein [Verrucomicrobiae bacterium]
MERRLSLTSDEFMDLNFDDLRLRLEGREVLIVRFSARPNHLQERKLNAEEAFVAFKREMPRYTIEAFIARVIPSRHEEV